MLRKKKDTENISDKIGKLYITDQNILPKKEKFVKINTGECIIPYNLEPYTEILKGSLLDLSNIPDNCDTEINIFELSGDKYTIKEWILFVGLIQSTTDTYLGYTILEIMRVNNLIKKLNIKTEIGNIVV